MGTLRIFGTTNILALVVQKISCVQYRVLNGIKWERVLGIYLIVAIFLKITRLLTFSYKFSNEFSFNHILKTSLC